MGPAPASVQSVGKFSAKSDAGLLASFLKHCKPNALLGSIAIHAGHIPGDVLGWATEWGPSSKSFLGCPSVPWTLLLSGFVSRGILSDFYFCAENKG